MVGVYVAAYIGGTLAAETYTCADGRYELRGLAAKGQKADVTIEFSSPYFETESHVVSVSPGATTTLDQPLTPKAAWPGSLVGVVTNASNNALLANARVTVVGLNLSTQTDANGVYHFSALSQGAYYVEASAVGYEGQYKVTTITALQTELLDFPLEPGLTPPRLSDIDGNGRVDAMDVQLVINKALGLGITGDADINRDKTVNATDVQMVINAALGIG